MNLEEMRARRKELVEKARNLRALANQENRELAEDEARQLEEWLARSEHLTVEIEREERLVALEEDTQRAHRQPIRPDVGQDEQRRAAGQPQRFRSLGEQLQAVARAAMHPNQADPRLDIITRAALGANEGMPSEGGTLVQTDFSAELFQRVYETGQVVSRCRYVPISGNANGTKINGIDETSRANGSRHGGIQAYWAAEAGNVTATKPKFRPIELNLKKLMGVAYATDENLQDAAQLEQVIRDAFTDEFAFKLDDAAFNGDGSGKPLGILNAAALVTVSKETGQPAATLQPENIIKMWSRCWARSRLNAVWFINQDIEPQLFTLGIQIGTGGSTVYMPPGGLSQQPYGTLFGRPVIPIEQCATLGTVGDIVLADMSQYALARKGTMQTAVSIHVQFLTDETAFRFIMRVDGQPYWHAALTPFKGSNTLSPFVALATRA